MSEGGGQEGGTFVGDRDRREMRNNGGCIYLPEGSTEKQQMSPAALGILNTGSLPSARKPRHR